MIVSKLTSHKRVALAVIAIALMYPLFGTANVSAQPAEPAPAASCDLPDSVFLGIPTWYKYLEGEVDASRTTRTEVDENGVTVTGVEACSPVIDDVNSALPIGLVLLEGMLRLAGVVAVVMIFWASLKFLTSNGNGDTAAEARRTAINAVIGLVIIIISTSVVSFIGNKLIDPGSVTGYAPENQSTQYTKETA